MEPNTREWLVGLLGAAISGAANGIAIAFTANTLAPGIFNIEHGLRDTLSLAAVSAGTSTITGAMAYLKESPLPKARLRRAADTQIAIANAIEEAGKRADKINTDSKKP